MNIEPGDAFAIKISSHRHQWNGQICTNPMQWNCGTPEEFRESHCERGNERCFHLNVFAPGIPKVVIPERSIVQLLGNNPALLDDQILFFLGMKFDLRSGRGPNGWEQTLYGAYRVKRATIENVGVNQNVVIEPYPDGWAVFPRNLVRKPPISPAFDDVSYLNRISRLAATRAINDAVQEAEVLSGSDALSPSLIDRLDRFADSFDGWLETAKENLAAQKIMLARRTSGMNLQSTGGLEGSLAGQLKEALAGRSVTFPKMVTAPSVAKLPVNDPEKSVSEVLPQAAKKTPILDGAAATSTISTVVNASDVGRAETPPLSAERETAETAETATVSSNWKRLPLPEPAQCTEILAEYGDRTIKALQIATTTKSLVLLAGAPGVGKSWLATRLIDDPARERSVIIPVSSTWRGREDLFGYINPINGEFEATGFTHFLRRAERAWQNGDRRPWLVVFEEFNLSQPEHWLSDLLVRLEYEPHHTSDRTICLGGSKISGESDGAKTDVFLPPTLIMVGTLNHDHTVRALSPRVLDRATLLEISATGRAALARVGMENISTIIEEVVDDLNDVLEPRGVAFSVRSARSLRQAINAFGQEQAMTVLDHVILQEVLSKVRLIAGDPQDQQLVNQLNDWSNREACVELILCRERIDLWLQTLQSSRDVFQA